MAVGRVEGPGGQVGPPTAAPRRVRTRDEHLFGPGPKRILALDGGGVLGVIEIAFLEEIERLLRAQHGDDPEFRLCDYFDLIGGTSTGAIIATALAMGGRCWRSSAMMRRSMPACSRHCTISTSPMTSCRRLTTSSIPR